MLQPGHYSNLTAPNLQPTANQERNDQYGNQHHSRELLMMGIVIPRHVFSLYEVQQNSKWHLVGCLFFSYHNDARPNKHQIMILFLCGGY